MNSLLTSLLKTKHEIDVVFIETPKHRFNEKDIPQDIKSAISFNSFFINTSISIISAFFNLFSKSSYNINRFYSKKLAAILFDKIASSNYDILLLETTYLIPYALKLKSVFKGKIIIRSHNIEYKIWEDYAKNETKLTKKTYYRYLASKLKKAELSGLNKVDLVLAISPIDSIELSKLCSSKVELIPYSLTTSHRKTTFSNHDFFFIGAYNWKPNLDALHFIISDIFPKLKKQNPSVTLHIAGSFMPDEFNKLASESIKIHGKVANAIEFMKNHGTLIAPIFSGSGVRIKILECMANSVPVIATDHALQGIRTESVYIANNADEFILKAEKLINQTTEIEHHLENARSYIAENYNIDIIEDQLTHYLLQLNG